MVGGWGYHCRLHCTDREAAAAAGRRPSNNTASRHAVPLPPTASSIGAAVPHCCLSNNFTLSRQTLESTVVGCFFSFASREMGMGWDVEGGRVFSLNAPHYTCVAPLVHDGDRQRLNRAKITCSDSL